MEQTIYIINNKKEKFIKDPDKVAEAMNKAYRKALEEEQRRRALEEKLRGKQEKKQEGGGKEEEKKDPDLEKRIIGDKKRAEKIRKSTLHEQVREYTLFINFVGRDYKGVGIAVVANIGEGDYKGVGIAGLTNEAEGDYKGVGIAGAVNGVEGDYRGVSIAGGGNLVEGDYRGVSIAGFANLVGGRAKGAQIASFNYAKSIDDYLIQFGLVNYVTESTERNDRAVLQVGLFNKIEDQIVPFVNVAGLIGLARKIKEKIKERRKAK